VFAKLTALKTQNTQPATVHNRVREVLKAHYGGRAKPEARSIKVMFDFDGGGFVVDSVPAVRMGERWGIPRRKVESWESPNIAERWVETDPERLAKLTTERNRAPEVGDQGAYVPTVKLVRQTRRHHLAERKPGGLNTPATGASVNPAKQMAVSQSSAVIRALGGRSSHTPAGTPPACAE